MKQELETHDLAELDCECFEIEEFRLLTLTLPEPNPDAFASSPLLDAQLQLKTDLTYKFAQAVINHGHQYLRSRRAYGRGVLKEPIGKKLLAPSAGDSPKHAAALVHFYFFDDDSLFEGSLLDKRRFESVEKK
ncbi:MAG: hypothetical protein H9847_05205 [Candidatus Anaerobiospirillum pullicola]|uniref:Uncharacterized protein n=1 Tax=Candidatus Anaerobiospirillum pullicola TaxID=2838451 RepID=A0A948TG46_9GAMM|nr:hypothetical protein [Candidatus Anaerobiospirillum pullicola]